MQPGTRDIGSGSGRCSNCRPGGFTLVELLVVIAIIALLVSILLPSLQSAQELAKAAVCMGNLKAMHNGFLLYGEDYDGKWPYFHCLREAIQRYGVNNTPEARTGCSWPLGIYPYVENLDAYSCPGYQGSDEVPIHGYLNGQEYLAQAQYKSTPYLGHHKGSGGPGVWAENKSTGKNYGGYIQYLMGTYDEYTWESADTTRIVAGSDKVLLFDNLLAGAVFGASPGEAAKQFYDVTGDGDRSNPDNYGSWSYLPQIGPWHRKGANFVFVDGHGEWMSPQDPRSWGGDDPEASDRRHWILYK